MRGEEALRGRAVGDEPRHVCVFPLSWVDRLPYAAGGGQGLGLVSASEQQCIVTSFVLGQA
jgi:hypothetical protein